MKAISNHFEGIETHVPLVTNIALWFTMLTPFIGLITAFLGAWFFGRLSG